MKKIFIFKEEEYALKELFKAHQDNRNFYKSGDIIDSETGECFDISEIYDMKEKYYSEFIDMKDHRIIWGITQQEKENSLSRLNTKFRNGNITLEELEWLLKLEKGADLKSNFYVIFPRNGTFYRKYHAFKYPEDLSTLNIGRLHLLLDFMTYSNEIKRTQRNNSNYPTTEELIDYMRVKDRRTLNRTLNDLKKHGIIDYKRENNKKIIYINPLFSDRNLKIHPEIYRKFKSQLDEYLTDKEIRYLEMLTFEDTENGVLTLKD